MKPMKRAAVVRMSSNCGLGRAFHADQGTSPKRGLERLHAHFEKVVRDRHDRAFGSITTVEQWERRKQEIGAALHRMLWSDVQWPDAPPPARVTHREQHPACTIENVVLETAPGVFLTSNLYLPSGTGPFPVVLYQCGHANKSYFKRHGAWFAAHGIAALVMDNIEELHQASSPLPLDRRRPVDDDADRALRGVDWLEDKKDVILAYHERLEGGTRRKSSTCRGPRSTCMSQRAC